MTRAATHKRQAANSSGGASVSHATQHPTDRESVTQAIRSIARPTRPRRRHDLIVHALDDEGLIFDSQSCDTHRLNGTAMYIWQRCDGATELQTMIDDMVCDYDVAPDDARMHTLKAVQSFERLGLLMSVETKEHDH